MHNFGQQLISTQNGPKWAQNESSLKQAIAAQDPRWYENFVFENGASTPGRSPSSSKLHSLCLPNSLKGYKILDVGAYEGYYSAAMEQRGADVIANDAFIWHVPGDPSL
jgi:2-polyprenyl-3-methyl-5-hydroxy-6-metoxy-1,4-benzoquinol methylase